MEVAVESQDVRRPKLCSDVNKAGIRQINFTVAIFAEYVADLGRRF